MEHINTWVYAQAWHKAHKDVGLGTRRGVWTYPRARICPNTMLMLDLHHPSKEIMAKASRHAKKAIKHARKQDKAKNMLGKAIKHIMTKDKAKAVDCS